MVAQELGVSTVLERSIRRAGDRVRITAQLIDAGSDSHLWSETYDREMNDVFAFQDDIAQSITRALELLENAVNLGWGDRSWLETDSDLDSLRQIDGFKALLEGID